MDLKNVGLRNESVFNNLTHNFSTENEGSVFLRNVGIYIRPRRVTA